MRPGISSCGRKSHLGQDGFAELAHFGDNGVGGIAAKAEIDRDGLDGLMAGKTYVCGNRLTPADTLLFAFVDFAAGVGLPINPDLKNITAWHARMKARPSAAA